MYYIYSINLKLKALCSTLCARLLMLLSGIKVGKKSKFWGLPFFLKYPKSEIIIGDGFRNRNFLVSNLIGINHKSIIATHAANAKIIIGNGCGMSGVVIGAKESIIIGDEVLVGANVLITDFDWHSLNPLARNSGEIKSAPIYIGNNVFIGYGCTILKGVTIGNNSVIGANSVVSINIPPNCIAGGNPCKVIKNL